MKMKYLAGVMLLMAGLCSLSSCSDDDYSAATGNVISTIETGDASVTAISAVVSGKVLDLSKQDALIYQQVPMRWVLFMVQTPILPQPAPSSQA